MIEARQTTAQRTSQFPPALSAVGRYALAVSSVALALGAALLLTRYHFHNVADPLFLFAIAVSVWYLGPGPGIVALALASLADVYFFIEPIYTIYITRDDLPHFAIFVLFALLLTWYNIVRRRAEAELRQARDKLEIEVAERTQQASLLNLTHDSIMVRNMDFVITYWNRGAQELYGWTPEEAVGTRSDELLRTIFPAPVKEIRAELLRTERWEGELKRIKRGRDRGGGGKPMVFAARRTRAASRRHGNEQRHHGT